MSDADVIRRAADVLRSAAQQATDGYWSTVTASGCGIVAQPYHSMTIAQTQQAADADYIATVHPGVGRALADALQQHADDHLSGVGCWVQCGILATARAILQETP